MIKKLMGIVRKIRAKIAVNTSKHPGLAALIILVFINLLIVAIGTSVTIAVDGGSYNHYFHAMLDVGKWLIFPSSALNVEGDASSVIAIGIAIFGMILFTGTVIALATNYLRLYIAQKADGGGKLPLSNHIVILNYNSQVLAILTDLMHDGVDDTVIILSDKTREFVRGELAGELAGIKDKPNSRLNLIARKGDPDSAAELADINIQGARCILVMDDENAAAKESDISAADFDTIKLLLKLASFEIPVTCPIVVEAESSSTAGMIREMKKTVAGLRDKSVEVFSYNKKLGQFLALSILYPSMTNVLYNLLSYSGSVFYPVGRVDTEEYLASFTSSIPIINMGENTFVLTDDIKLLGQKRKKNFFTDRLVAPLPDEAGEKGIKLLVLGSNKKSPYMLEALREQRKNIEICIFESSRRAEFIDALRDAADDGEKDYLAVILSEDTKESDNRDENVVLTLIEINRNFGAENRPFKIVAEILEPKNQEIIEQFNIKNIIISPRIISFFVTKLLSGTGVDKFYEQVFSHHTGLTINQSSARKNPADADAKTDSAPAAPLASVGKGRTAADVGVKTNFAPLAKVNEKDRTAADVTGEESNCCKDGESVHAAPSFSLCIKTAGSMFDLTDLQPFGSFAEVVSGIYHGSNKKIMPLGIIRDHQTVYFCSNMDKPQSFSLLPSDQFIFIAYN